MAAVTMGAEPQIPRLHAAIWEGNAARVRTILQEAARREDGASREPTARSRELLEAKDAHGNTALHLAVRLVQPAQREIVQTLLEHGASVSSRSKDGWSCLHDATLCDDEFLLAQLFLRGERQLWSEVEEHQDDFLDALERLPDFEVEIFVEAYSWIPGVSKILPSQTNRIYKRGSQLRVDSSMKGLERFNLNYGNISHIFTGRTADRDGEGRAYILNHDTKRFYDVSSAVNGTSSLAKIDLGIHMLLTKELSTTSIDSSKLEFKKRKDVKEIKTKKKNGSSKRACPWTGTKYEMKNFAATFAFRSPINPRRQHRKFAEGNIDVTEAALGRIDGYVSELHGKETKRSSIGARSMMDTSIHDDDADRARAAGENQELWLSKRKSMEMHLDVLAGDVVSWNFSCTSKEYSFESTCYQDDEVIPVSRCEGVKSVPIIGQFTPERNGSFVLKWSNTHKGFSLDKKGVKVTYKVTHTRQPSVIASTNNQLPASSSSVPVGEPAPPSDVEICRQFIRSDHIANPMTVTVSFSDYFSGAQSDEGTKGSPKPAASKSIASRFKRNSKHSANTPSRGSDVPALAIFDGTEYRNTFRSITLQPTPRRFHKNFEAKVFMAQDFPIQTQDFLPVIEFLSKTGDQVKNLSDFFRMKLPPGFPVRFELPMMFTVRAAYTFQKAVIRDDIDPTLFSLPAGYTKADAIKDILPPQNQ